YHRLHSAVSVSDLHTVPTPTATYPLSLHDALPISHLNKLKNQSVYLEINFVHLCSSLTSPFPVVIITFICECPNNEAHKYACTSNRSWIIPLTHLKDGKQPNNIYHNKGYDGNY